MHYTTYPLLLTTLLNTVLCQISKLFISQPAFVQHPWPSILLESPEFGPTGSYLDIDHTREGAGSFPALSWPYSSGTAVQEYILLVEDPDAPTSEAVVHGLFYGVHRATTGVQNPDFFLDQSQAEPFMLRGGFKYGLNAGDAVYFAPLAPRGQGPHRYFFELVALNETLDQQNIPSPARLEDIMLAINGKVAGWGAWMALSQRA
ncbi:YbhB/YbcL family Raf kinase inhibitor-like protein [Aspergillus saccharolyticus JOP 1030-1]|uniref:PEBP-like protein n=1 Tax=Aspergillus saccharolyticus JOP 1030-1 TaxID=1450539 RepID=A0A318Z994_9EURO|nr:PEBP-like protein [Aspergillus saccharolyticus JOP 1030-1]PYH41283.1 PEBP-like protein [Aspergillus saccharolyticus JOP 1030-1]